MGKILRALIIVICAVAVFSFVNNGIEKARLRREAMEQIKKAKNEADEKIRASIQGDGSPQEAVDQLNKFSDKFSTAMGNVGGKEKVAAEGMKSFMGIASTKMQEYSTAYDKLLKVGFTSPKGIVTRDDLKHRRELIDAFGKANENLTQFCQNSEAILHDELKKKNMDETTIGQVITGYRRSSPMDVTLQIRKCDDDMVVAGRKMLDIFEKEWGAWKLNAEGAIIFENDEAVSEWQKLETLIEQTAAKQNSLQQALLKRMEASK